MYYEMTQTLSGYRIKMTGFLILSRANFGKSIGLTILYIDYSI